MDNKFAFARPIGTMIGKFNAPQDGMTLREYYIGQVIIGLADYQFPARIQVKKAIEIVDEIMKKQKESK